MDIHACTLILFVNIPVGDKAAEKKLKEFVRTHSLATMRTLVNDNERGKKIFEVRVTASKKVVDYFANALEAL